MDKTYKPSEHESKLYAQWESMGLFTAKVNNDKTPFTIILPPPNANGDLHTGHVMYMYEDIMIRYQKMMGKEVLWLPGFDHAGFETQYVFEKHLKKQGKSRFDYDRETLYKMIWDFCEENKPKMRSQLKRLGFALDWSKEQYAIDPGLIRIVHETFQKLFEKKLLYRKSRLVNYCTVCGTSFSDLEVVYEEQQTKLWYLKYPLKDNPEKFITVATTRPETMLGDTAVAVNPKDKRYKDIIGKYVILPLVHREIPIIADEMVDPKFGTGAVKITPAHDENDWQVAQRHNLPMIQVVGFNGRMMEETGKYAGLKVKVARESVLVDLSTEGALEQEKEYTHRVGVCYKNGTVIEPLPLEQWFIQIKPLASKAMELISKDIITIFPKKYKKQSLQILEKYVDWNVSRQNVWGIRIPAFKHKTTGEWVVEIDEVKQEQLTKSGEYEQDTDTFDTWFSSGQWPYATLRNIGQEYFEYFYPTSVMETGHDILRAWVTRMIMLGHFSHSEEGKEIPFKHVFLHGMVRDKHGMKMSKSKGNVVNPIEFMDKYGADALRAAILFGTKDGGDTNISEEKVIGMRNFGNKLWNIGRFISMSMEPSTQIHSESQIIPNPIETKQILKELTKETKSIKKQFLKSMSAEHYSQAFDLIYHFAWHRLADYYIEKLKDELKNGNIGVLESLKTSYFEQLKMLHPFMPFVTDTIWQVFHGSESVILNESI